MPRNYRWVVQCGLWECSVRARDQFDTCILPAGAQCNGHRETVGDEQLHSFLLVGVAPRIKPWLINSVDTLSTQLGPLASIIILLKLIVALHFSHDPNKRVELTT